MSLDRTGDLQNFSLLLSQLSYHGNMKVFTEYTINSPDAEKRYKLELDTIYRGHAPYDAGTREIFMITRVVQTFVKDNSRSHIITFTFVVLLT